MAIVRKECIDNQPMPNYHCNECGVVEKGRLRGAFYVKKDLQDRLVNNIDDYTVWEELIEGENLFLIPSTRGTFDGGTRVAVAGFGDDVEKMTGKDFVAVVNDPNHNVDNAKFYEALAVNYKEYIFGFRTGDQLRVATDAITILDVQDPVEDDVESVVTWNATVTWNQKVPEVIVPVYKLDPRVKALFTCNETTA